MATDIIARGMASKSGGDVKAHTDNNDIHVTASDKSNWNNKVDKNQGSENSGKVLGTNANGEVIPINGYGFEYDEETKMLKYGTDPTSNLNQGIGLDDTLSKTGYAADAGAVGELKEDLGEFESFVGYRKVWRNGSVGAGGVVTEGTSNSAITDLVTLSSGTIAVASGYKIRTIKFYKNGTYYSHSDYQTVSLAINQAFVDMYDCILEVKREDNADITPNDVINAISTDISTIKIVSKFDDLSAEVYSVEQNLIKTKNDIVGKRETYSYTTTYGTELSAYFNCSWVKNETVTLSISDTANNTKMFGVLFYNGNTKIQTTTFYASETKTITLKDDITKVQIYLNASTASTSTGTLTIGVKGLTDDLSAEVTKIQESITSKYYDGAVNVVVGVSDTHYINCEFGQGDTIAFGLKCGFYMAKAIAFYYVTKTGEKKLLKDNVQAYHAYSTTLTEDIIQLGVYISKDNYTSSGQYNLYVRSLTDAGVKPHIIRVSPTQNNLYTTISSITDADIYNPYQIILREGTYDLMQEFTSEMINSAVYTNDGFVGLSLADGISIIGDGDRDKIIIKCELDTSTYSQSIRNLIAPLNPKGNCNVENVTILGINTRYAVHDDFDYNRYSVQNFKNCRFIEQNSTGGSAFGCGTTSGFSLNMENCICENGGAVFHTNTNLNKGSCVHLTNCEVHNVYLGDSDSQVVCKAIFDNCKIRSIQHEIVGSHNQYYEISGCGTDGVSMNIANGVVYSVGDVITRIIDNVAVGDVLDYNFVKTTNPDLAYAIVVGYKEGKAYLQRSGYLTSTTIGLSGLSEGEHLTVNSNSKVVNGGTKSNAIAIVKKSSDGKSYCKMIL